MNKDWEESIVGWTPLNEDETVIRFLHDERIVLRYSVTDTDVILEQVCPECDAVLPSEHECEVPYVLLGPTSLSKTFRDLRVANRRGEKEIIDPAYIESVNESEGEGYSRVKSVMRSIDMNLEYHGISVAAKASNAPEFWSICYDNVAVLPKENVSLTFYNNGGMGADLLSRCCGHKFSLFKHVCEMCDNEFVGPHTTYVNELDDDSISDSLAAMLVAMEPSMGSYQALIYANDLVRYIRHL